jgi:hypothetical protein
MPPHAASKINVTIALITNDATHPSRLLKKISI